MHLARRFSPVLAGIFAFVVAVAVFGAPPAPAQAHDTLVSSDPAPDSVLDSVPTEVTLTFSGEIVGDGGANAIVVTDASGAEVNGGELTVNGETVTQPLSPDAGGGTFGVVWRVVSSDGHPISGEFMYQVAAPAPTPTASESEIAEPAAEVTDSPSAVPAAPPADEDSEGLGVWAITGIAALVLALIVLITAFVRRRAQHGNQS